MYYHSGILPITSNYGAFLFSVEAAAATLCA